MATLTADTEEILDEIDSREDVDDVLEEASDLQREIQKRKRKIHKSTSSLREEKEAIEEEIEDIEDKNGPYIDRREEAIEARKEAIRQFALQNTDEVLDGIDGRTYDSIFGKVSLTKVPFNFSWDDKEQVIERLKQLGHDDLLRHEVKVPYKSTLKDKPQLVEQLDGVTPQPEHDEVTVTLDA